MPIGVQNSNVHASLTGVVIPGGPKCGVVKGANYAVCVTENTHHLATRIVLVHTVFVDDY